MFARMSRLAALFIAMTAASPGRADTPPTSIKFGYEVFAIADGPCVICLTITNVSDDAIVLIGWSEEALLARPVDLRWNGQIRMYFLMGRSEPEMRRYQLKPQETHRKLISLHHDYQISTMPADIQIKAKFREHLTPRNPGDGGKGAVVVDFGCQIKVRPSENNPAEREKLIARLKGHGRTLSAAERAEFYRDCVLHTNIKELLPLALEAAREREASDSRFLIDWMSKTLSREEFWRVFETEGISAASPNPSVWLECAKSIEAFPSRTEYIELEEIEIPIHAHPVGEEQYRLMRASPNMIARLAAAYYFPKSHTNPELKALLAEAAKWKPPLTEDELKWDVKMLASNSFREREAAARRLRVWGERGVAPLTRLLDSASDLETLARLKAIIQQAKTSTPSPGDDYFITRLAVETENRETRVAILKALAKNDPAAHITRLAEKGLRELAQFEEFRAKQK